MKRHDDSAPRPSYQPIWELGSDERLLDPGPGALSGGCDVLVVAGGVIGLATAALCRRAGLGRVAVVERGRLAGGGAGWSTAPRPGEGGSVGAGGRAGAAGGDGGDARGRGLQRGAAFPRAWPTRGRGTRQPAPRRNRPVPDILVLSPRRRAPAASAGAMKRQRGGMNGRSWRIVQQTARRASSWRSV